MRVVLGNRRCMRIATRACQKITLINRDTGSDSGDAKRQTGKTTPTESVFAINKIIGIVNRISVLNMFLYSHTYREIWHSNMLCYRYPADYILAREVCCSIFFWSKWQQRKKGNINFQHKMSNFR